MRNQKNKKCSYFKLLFGNSTITINIYLLITISMITLIRISTPIYKIFYGYGLNFIQDHNFSGIEKISLILCLFGFANLILSSFGGFNCWMHSELLTKQYKESYYSLVLDQDFLWFNKKNIHELSEGVKNDLIQIEAAVK